VGEQGEVCVHGYALMKGYDGDPEGTAQVIKEDGWLHTGDLGIMHEDGCIHLTGRSRDVIIRGGENIYPREVEEFLYTHPKVDEAQVVGIPNARLGEIVAAWVRLRPASKPPKKRSRSSARARSPTTRFPSTSASSPSSRRRLRQDTEVQDSRVRDRGAGIAQHRRR
jgi:acyl-CoA synthetase (AMP-forming)/AMP-acid ligase II